MGNYTLHYDLPEEETIMDTHKLYYLAGGMNCLAGAVWLFTGNSLGIVFVLLGAIFIGLGRGQSKK